MGLKFYRLTQIAIVISFVFFAVLSCSVDPGGSGTTTVSVTTTTGTSTTTTTTTTVAPGSVVYAADWGSNSYDGLHPETPLYSLSNAVELARLSNLTVRHIYVSGDYVLTSGVNHSGWYVDGLTNVSIEGGWSPDFTEQTNLSLLGGGGVCYHVVYLYRCSGVGFSSFVVTGGSAPSLNYGGGLYLDSSSGNTLSCIVTNNSAYEGGGIYLCGASVDNTIGGMIQSNTAVTGGGGIYILNGVSNRVAANVWGNTAQYGGGVYLASSSTNTVSGYVRNNTATANGGGIYILGGGNNLVSGTSEGNSAPLGGGLYLFSSGYNTVSGTLSGNTASSNGAGIYIYYADDNTIGGTLSGNNAAYCGGGIAVVYSDHAYLTGLFSFNTAKTGGGIYLDRCDHVDFSGRSIRNSVSGSANGGGVCLVFSSNNTFSGVVTNNYAGSAGGGYYLQNSGLNTVGGLVADNTAVSGGSGGGGLAVFDGFGNTLSADVRGNSSTYGYGGGLFILRGAGNTVSGTVLSNLSYDSGGGICLRHTTNNTLSASSVIRFNHCNTGDSGIRYGGGVYAYQGSGSAVQSGCVYSPNYNGSGTTTEDDLYGIAEP